MKPFVRYALIGALSLSFAGLAFQAVAADFDARASNATEFHQFDFLLGQWQVKGEVKVSGLIALIHGTPKLAGSWKAWHAADGHSIEDELRLTDTSGNPLSSVHSKRTFYHDENCWKITGLDVLDGHAQSSTGHWQGGEMVIVGRGIDHEGKRYQNRTHFKDIASKSFRMVQDRSYDEGQTWDTAYVTLDASRKGN